MNIEELPEKIRRMEETIDWLVDAVTLLSAGTMLPPPPSAPASAGGVESRQEPNRDPDEESIAWPRIIPAVKLNQGPKRNSAHQGNP